MRFKPGDGLRLERDLGAALEGDYSILSAAGAWVRIGRLSDGPGPVAFDVPKNLLAEYGRALNVEAEVD